MLSIGDLAAEALEGVLGRYGLGVVRVDDGAAIPGSYWGEPEAGLVADTLYVRGDTPLHSALHEACHWIVMDPARRAALHTDAGGEDHEECGVCYLQILLAGEVPGASSEALCRDMDAWGYSFREGSTAAWLEGDAADARAWLLGHGLLGPEDEILWKPRGPEPAGRTGGGIRG